MKDSTLSRFLDTIGAEVERALGIHGPRVNLHELRGVAEEEFDELWDLIKLNPRKPMVHPTKGYPMTSAQWRAELMEELVQLAAMAVTGMELVARMEREAVNGEITRFGQNLAASERPVSEAAAKVLREQLSELYDTEAPVPAHPQMVAQQHECVRVEQSDLYAHHVNGDPLPCGENWGNPDSALGHVGNINRSTKLVGPGDVDLLDNAPERIKAVHFSCGCSRVQSFNGSTVESRCADGQCQRLGRR